MFVNAVAKVSKSMFPIFRTTPLPNNQTNIGVAGTGFFISNDGIFLTVAHLFDGSAPGTRYIYAGLLPENTENPQLDIQELARDNDHDIYLGKVQKSTESLNLLEETVPTGRTICIGGYPLAQLTGNAHQLDVSGVRRYYQPSFVLDRSIAKITNDAGLMRTHDGFLLRDVGLFGMSGGPVFDTDARVVGVQAAVTSPRVSQSGTRTISVENAIAIRSDLALEFIKAQKIELV